MQTDEQLCSNFIQGDEEAFEFLLRRHIDAVYSFARRLTGDESDAEDIVQESFLRAWKHMSRFDPKRGRFKTWLMQIARNASIDLLRKKRSIPLSSFDAGEVNQIEDTLEDLSPLQDEIIARKEDHSALNDALDKLTPAFKEILLLYSGSDLTFDEVSEILGIPRNTAKSRYRRALAALRAALHPK